MAIKQSMLIRNGKDKDCYDLFLLIADDLEEMKQTLREIEIEQAHIRIMLKLMLKDHLIRLNKAGVRL
jgi:hypothetical protein